MGIDGKTALDHLFDKADEALDGIEKLTGYKEGVWKVDEIIDNDTGQEIFCVTDGIRAFSTTNKEHAQWLRGVISK